MCLANRCWDTVMEKMDMIWNKLCMFFLKEQFLQGYKKFTGRTDVHFTFSLKNVSS
jgi:hypothetical protein